MKLVWKHLISFSFLNNIQDQRLQQHPYPYPCPWLGWLLRFDSCQRQDKEKFSYREGQEIWRPMSAKGDQLRGNSVSFGKIVSWCA
jgi:hypothetical protein